MQGLKVGSKGVSMSRPTNSNSNIAPKKPSFGSKMTKPKKPGY